MIATNTLYRLSLLESLTHRVPKNFHPIATAFEFDTELQAHVLYVYGGGDASALKVEKAFAVVNASRVPLGFPHYPFLGMAVHPVRGYYTLKGHLEDHYDNLKDYGMNEKLVFSAAEKFARWEKDLMWLDRVNAPISERLKVYKRSKKHMMA